MASSVDHLASKGQPSIGQDLCLTLLLNSLLKCVLLALFLFSFWSQIRMKVMGPLLCNCNTSVYKLFALVYTISFVNLKVPHLFLSGIPNMVYKKEVWQFSKHTKTKVSLVKIFLFTLQKIWLYNIFRATMSFKYQFTLYKAILTSV